jgi:uncharacterized protein YbaR (Trm112 family)
MIAVVACAEPSGPSTHLHSQRVLIAGTDEGAIVVDLDWRGIIRRSGPRFLSQASSVFNGRGDLLTAGVIAGNTTVLAGLDIETGLELWRTTVNQGNTPTVVDGVELGATMITANPSRPEVFLSRSVQGGVGGIAGYDYDRRRITRFFGPVSTRLRAVAATPVSAAHPEGCLVLGLDAIVSGNVRAFLHVACGTSYPVRDSIPIALPSRTVVQMELTPDRRELVVMTDMELIKFDVSTLAVTVRATRPLAAPFFMSRATGRFIIPDVGSALVASSGLIYLLDANLELSSIIDLRILPFGERPLGILSAEESRDGKWLYIVGGVPPGGPLYGPEATHILVIEKSTGSVVDTVNLDAYGGGRAVLVP